MALTGPADVALARFAGRTWRLVAARWPTVGAFDTVASPEDLAAALEIEALTDDRVVAANDRLGRIPRSEWVVGRPGATLVMAAFRHPAPGGGRFNADALGAWCCAGEIETAIAETVFHHTRRLAHSASGFRHTIQMRALRADLDAPFHDIRGESRRRPDLYDPWGYAASQPWGEALRRQGSNGVLYDSVRRHGGRNVVVYRPALLPPVREGDRYDYRWSGSPQPEIVRLTTLQAGSPM